MKNNIKTFEYEDEFPFQADYSFEMGKSLKEVELVKKKIKVQNIKEKNDDYNFREYWKWE